MIKTFSVPILRVSCRSFKQVLKQKIFMFCDVCVCLYSYIILCVNKTASALLADWIVQSCRGLVDDTDRSIMTVQFSIRLLTDLYSRLTNERHTLRCMWSIGRGTFISITWDFCCSWSPCSNYFSQSMIPKYGQQWREKEKKIL